MEPQVAFWSNFGSPIKGKFKNKNENDPNNIQKTSSHQKFRKHLEYALRTGHNQKRISTAAISIVNIQNVH